MLAGSARGKVASTPSVVQQRKLTQEQPHVDARARLRADLNERVKHEQTVYER